MKFPASLIALPLAVFFVIGTLSVTAIIQPKSALTGVNDICELIPWWPGCP
jgi:hypothetical protein